MQTSRAHKEPRTRQLGVTEHPPEHVLLVALDFLATDSVEARSSLERLRAVVRAELRGELADESTETGELGYERRHRDYELTVTVGFALSGYNVLAVPAEQRPQDLQPMPADMLDSSGLGRGPQLPGEGDIMLKVAADDAYIVEHVVRRVEHELLADFRIRWVQSGVQRFNTRQSRNPSSESRALIGFLDGTSNLNPSQEEHRRLIFTHHDDLGDYPPLPVSDQYSGASFPAGLRPPPSAPEPKALDGGTYMAIEVLKQNTAAFDAAPVAEQEQVVGRTKRTGDPVSVPNPTSHVQKSNPARNEDDAKRRVLRRGYSLLRPEGNGLARGLVLVVFGRTLSTQVEFIQRGWMNNPNFPINGAGIDQLMARFVDPQLVCGGSYFVPPLRHPNQPWSWII